MRAVRSVASAALRGARHAFSRALADVVLQRAVVFALFSSLELGAFLTRLQTRPRVLLPLLDNKRSAANDVPTLT